MGPLARRLKEGVERLLDCRIYRHSLPRGVDLSYDIRTLVRPGKVGTVFDVGANVGQSVERFARWFPGASIYSFEPVSSVYDELVARNRNNPSVHPFRLALGSRRDQLNINIHRSSDRSSIGPPGNGPRELIEVVPVDEFCESNGVERIDVMKIDVEGYELEVLAGARRMLSSGRVDCLFIEADYRDGRDGFVSLAALDGVLREAGYSVFAIYDQIADVKRRINHLYFFNVAYVRDEIATQGFKAIG